MKTMKEGRNLGAENSSSSGGAGEADVLCSVARPPVHTPTPVRVPLRSLDQNLPISSTDLGRDAKGIADSSSPEIGALLRALDRNRQIPSTSPAQAREGKSSSPAVRVPLGSFSIPSTSTAQARVSRGKENAAPGVVDIKPKLIDDDRLVPGNLPPIMQIGTVGSCLEAQNQAQWQRKPRRQKQGAVIVKPPFLDVEPREPVLACGVLGELNPGILRGVRDPEHVKMAIKAIIDPSRKRTRELATKSENLRKRFVAGASEELQQMPDCDVLRTRGILGRDCATVILPTQSCDDERTDTADDDGDPLLENQHQEQVIDGSSRFTWMKLMQQDIKGRMSVAKRTRRLVRHATVADDVFVPMAESNLRKITDVEKRQYALQMDKLRGLFIKTENGVSKEISQLENQLKQLEGTPCSCSEL